MPLNVLIVGAGICGPTFAYFLQSSDPRHKITVVERSPALRANGQQIDVQDAGKTIMEKAGLLDAIKARCVAEAGAELVNSKGKPVARFGVSNPDKGQYSFTQEHEIMRGDLVKVLYEASLEQRAKLDAAGEGKGGNLTYEFGKSITALTQEKDGVEVTFTDGQRRRYDLVVGADGQSSRTRRLAFGQAASDEAFYPFGFHAAYCSIPKVENAGELAQGYFAPGGRWVLLRSADQPSTALGLIMANGAYTQRLRDVSAEPMDQQKKVWQEVFRGAGWKTDEFLDALDRTDDFYMSEIIQVRMKQVHKGRVALIGDAGYCPSAFTGMGTTLSFVGAYLLAGELARHGDDVPKALDEYERVIRPAINEYQKPFPRIVLWLLFPSSTFGISLLQTILWAVTCLSVPWVASLINWFKTESKDRWNTPEYPGLNL